MTVYEMLKLKRKLSQIQINGLEIMLSYKV